MAVNDAAAIPATTERRENDEFMVMLSSPKMLSPQSSGRHIGRGRRDQIESPNRGRAKYFVSWHGSAARRLIQIHQGSQPIQTGLQHRQLGR